MGSLSYQPVSLLTSFQNFFILRAAYRGKPRGLNPPPAFYVTFTTLGALIGLAIAIILIIRKISPAYSLIIGALIGGFLGGGGLQGTIGTMVSGAGSMMSSVLRILTAAYLPGP